MKTAVCLYILFVNNMFVLLAFLKTHKNHNILIFFFVCLFAYCSSCFCLLCIFSEGAKSNKFYIIVSCSGCSKGFVFHIFF